MSDQEGVGPYCDMRIVISAPGGITSSYDPRAGLSQELVVIGRIDDPSVSPFDGQPFHGVPGSKFHGATARIVIESVEHEEVVDPADAQSDEDGTFGFVGVEADVSSKSFELDGESVEPEPVSIHLRLGTKGFQAIARQISDAAEVARILWATVRLQGADLPVPKNRVQAALGVHLRDLDVSESRSYGITHFQLLDTRYFDEYRDRVLEPDFRATDTPKLHVEIPLSSVNYAVNVARARVHSISCDGRVSSRRRNVLENASVSISLVERRKDSWGELPECAHAGEFSIYNAPQDEGGGEIDLYLELFYLPQDIRDFLLPLMELGPSRSITLVADLLVDPDELRARTGETTGLVAAYGLNIGVRAPENS